MIRPRDNVIVIGGGAAGLAAAGLLTTAGIRTVILDARDRLGGRMHTVVDPQWPMPIERGAEFIHGRPPEIWNLLRRAALPNYEVEGRQWRKSGDRLQPADRDWEKMESALERLEKIGPDDMSFADFLATQGRDLPPAVRTLASRYVEGFDAADLNLISARSLGESERAAQQIEGDRMFRITAGYGALVEHLHAGIDPRFCDLRLNTVVTAIDWQPGEVTVASKSRDGVANQPVQGDAAIITLPLGVLQTEPDAVGGVRFSPDLPEKQGALGRLRMGPVVKVLLLFDTPFWEDGALADAAFLHFPDEPVPTWWTQAPKHVAVLTGWAGGPAAERLSRRDESTVLSAALDSLADGLGMPRDDLARRLRDSQVCDWQADPFSRGAYSFVTVGGLEAVGQLAAPVSDTLFFAGEATQGGFSGTVTSALASGYRAANELLKFAIPPAND